MKKESISPLQDSNVTFNHKTYVGEHGEVLYDMPLDADDIDLKDFNATAKDLVTLRYNGTDNIRVLFVKTDNLELAKFQWSYIDEKHNQKMRDSRCMVPGAHGMIICPKKHNCNCCPFGKKPEEKERHTISWDGLIDKGYEPAIGVPVETQVIRDIELEEVKVLMNAKDPRIWRAFAMKEIYGESVDVIKEELGVSAPRVYQFVAEAQAIGRQYRKDNP